MIPTLTPQLSPELLYAKDLIVKRYLGKTTGAHVIGVGIGTKDVNGKPAWPCVRVYVNQKIAPDDLTPRELIPKEIGNIPTDIIDVGTTFMPDATGIRMHPGSGRSVQPEPGELGSSIGLRPESTRHLGRLISGTLGAVLEGPQGTYLISCNHILSANGLIKETITKRGPVKKVEIVSPAPLDLVTGQEKVIASGVVFEPLLYDQVNYVDCAAALLTPEFRAERQARRKGGNPVESYAEAAVHDRVLKVGKTSGRTYGKVVDVNADILVDYSFGTFHFTKQILIEGEYGEFAADGDSGAVVMLDGSRMAVGMVFAPAGRYTAACPMLTVIERLSERIEKQRAIYKSERSSEVKLRAAFPFNLHPKSANGQSSASM
jgi:hypothetical protein